MFASRGRQQRTSGVASTCWYIHIPMKFTYSYSSITPLFLICNEGSGSGRHLFSRPSIVMVLAV